MSLVWFPLSPATVKPWHYVAICFAYQKFSINLVSVWLSFYQPLHMQLMQPNIQYKFCSFFLCYFNGGGGVSLTSCDCFPAFFNVCFALISITCFNLKHLFPISLLCVLIVDFFFLFAVSVPVFSSLNSIPHHTFINHCMTTACLDCLQCSQTVFSLCS